MAWDWWWGVGLIIRNDKEEAGLLPTISHSKLLSWCTYLSEESCLTASMCSPTSELPSAKVRSFDIGLDKLFLVEKLPWLTSVFQDKITFADFSF